MAKFEALIAPNGLLGLGFQEQKCTRGGGKYDHCSQEEDLERDDGHLLALHLAHDDHICYHLLQALFFRGR